jgi:hypothetical protein
LPGVVLPAAALSAYAKQHMIAAIANIIRFMLMILVLSAICG